MARLKPARIRADAINNTQCIASPKQRIAIISMVINSKSKSKSSSSSSISCSSVIII